MDPLVAIETVAYTAAVHVMISEVGTTQVGMGAAPIPPVTLQLSVTDPVKPFCGTRATIDDAVAPAATVVMPPSEIQCQIRVCPPASYCQDGQLEMVGNFGSTRHSVRHNSPGPSRCGCYQSIECR